MRASSMLFLLVAVMFSVSPVSAADGKAGREQTQLKRLQQSQRKLEQEKSQLAKEKEALDAQLKESQEKLDTTSRKASSAASRAAALSKELESVKTEKEVLATKLVETSEALEKSAVAGRRLDAELKQKTQGLAVCEDRNAKLHSQGVALLGKYQAKGCFDAALQSEPFTGLKQVEIENFIEDNRDKLDEQKLERVAPR